MIVGMLLTSFAKMAFTSALSQYINDAQNAFANTARDTVESAITGRRTIEEWADISIKGIDKIKNHIQEENGWLYVGGKLNFTISEKSYNKVAIAFELYFQDENKQWKKSGAESDMFASNFTVESLDEIRSQGVISFEVE